jgi:hypothetical protein
MNRTSGAGDLDTVDEAWPQVWPKVKHARLGTQGPAQVLRCHEHLFRWRLSVVGNRKCHPAVCTSTARSVSRTPPPNDETALRDLFTELAVHGRLLVVVDQPVSIGALAIAVARRMTVEVGYLPGHGGAPAQRRRVGPRGRLISAVGLPGGATIVEPGPPATAGDAVRVVVDGARLLGVT